jgi:alkylation response protein AidB-like acyl-CoA dehydrogenase
VPHAAGADQLLVAADSDDGALLCRVSPDAPGMLRVTRKMIDGCDISDINFTAVAASVVATNAAPLIARMQALLIISVSAELLGLGEAVMDLMLTQLQSREQFGRPIGSFQALQHRAVDAFISLELLRSLAFRVATAFDRGTAHPAMLAALKAKAGRGVLDVVRLALQMHGAMGYTDAHAIGRRTKRALSLSALYGGDAYQYDRFANLSGAVA